MGQWLGSAMTDNGWFTIEVSLTSAAQVPSGYYFYTLRVRNPNPSVSGVVNNFKLRTNGFATLKAPRAFAFNPALHSFADLQAIYPNYPNRVPTTYDGFWSFYLDVPTSTPSLIIWDGDFDYGSADLTDMDTDDPDTANDIIPPWAIGTGVTFEGVATGSSGATGGPPDDSMYQNIVRSPSVIYEVIDPNGNTYSNDNPSGNLEWEQFRIDSDPDQPADYHVASALPAGIYNVRVYGLDLSNLNAWRFQYDVLGITPDGEPGPMAKPYLVGDTIWYDADGDGVQDGGELGIEGVVVSLLDSNGYVIATTTTDANGYYDFEVDGFLADPDTGDVIVDGTYTVQVAPENFAPGGALEGMQQTGDPDGTLDNQYTDTVVDDNVMIYDFGYIADDAECRIHMYTVEHTINPFEGVKFNTLNEDGVKNGDYDLFRFTLDQAHWDALWGAGELQVEAKAGQTDVSAWLPLSYENGVYSGSVSAGGFTWELTDVMDHGDGTYTIEVRVTNTLRKGLSHVAFGVAASVPDTYTSQVCVE
jgi:hypothetical protein